MLYTTHLDRAHMGYSQAAFNYMMALYSAGRRDLSLIPVGGGVAWNQQPPWFQPLRELGSGDNRICIAHHTPDVVSDPSMLRGEMYNIGLTVTETDAIPEWLALRLNRLNGIIVPTDWNRSVFRESGVTVPIGVVPHAIGPHWWTGYEPKTDHDGTYTFGYVGAWNARKNPEGVIRAYCRAFPTPRKGVALALKVPPLLGIRALVAGIIADELGSADRLDEGDIWLYDARFSEDEIRWIFRDVIDCFVSTHRGEGWGLGLFQAALLGKPVIYTDWSAPCSFLSEEWAQPYDLVPSGFYDRNIIFQGQSKDREPIRWAEPALAFFANAMYLIACNPPDPEPTADLRATYNWRAVGEVFVDTIADLTS